MISYRSLLYSTTVLYDLYDNIYIVYIYIYIYIYNNYIYIYIYILCIYYIYDVYKYIS